MSKQKELTNKIYASGIRLWNLIIIDGEQVEIDEKVMGKLFKPSNTALLQKLQGIPITIEWLDRMGFSYRSEDDVYYVPIAESLDLEFNEDLSYGFREEDSWSGPLLSIWRDLSYVHQIQNFYFALTGKELSIDEE